MPRTWHAKKVNIIPLSCQKSYWET